MGNKRNVFKKAVDSLGLRFWNAELARELKFPKSNLSQYYNGIKLPSQNVIDALEKRYDIKLSDFEEDEDDDIRKELSDFSDLEIVEYISKNMDRFKELASFRLAVGLKNAEKMDKMEGELDKILKMLSK